MDSAKKKVKPDCTWVETAYVPPDSNTNKSLSHRNGKLHGGQPKCWGTQMCVRFHRDRKGGGRENVRDTHVLLKITLNINWIILMLAFSPSSTLQIHISYKIIYEVFQYYLDNLVSISRRKNITSYVGRLFGHQSSSLDLKKSNPSKYVLIFIIPEKECLWPSWNWIGTYLWKHEGRRFEGKSLEGRYDYIYLYAYFVLSCTYD